MAGKGSEKQAKCARSACNCEPEGGSKYCSASCQDAAGETGASCNCGHARCAEPKITVA